MTRILVFSPHPDDETLGCGGTIAKRIKEGFDVYVVFMTDGRNSHKYYYYPPPEKLKTLRRREALNALKILGVPKENIVFLDFEDGSLACHIPQAARKVEDLLLQIKPTEAFIPYEGDKHVDHRATSLIALYCIKKIKLPVRIYEYPIYKDINGTYRENINIELKTRAINSYKSQIKLLFSSQDRPILSDNFLQRFRRSEEVFKEGRKEHHIKTFLKLFYLHWVERFKKPFRDRMEILKLKLLNN